MSDAKPGFVQTVRSFPATFWVANTMEIFERMAWYGWFAVSSLYITGPKETGGLGFTSEQRGQLQAIVPFILYLLPVVTGALADRYGYKKMFIIAYAGMVVSYYSLGHFDTFPTFLAAFLGVALFAAVFKPVVVGTVARVTNAGNSAMGFGIFYMMVNIGGFLGPLVAGVVRGMSWKYVFIACACWAAVNLLIVLLFFKDPSTEATSAQKRTLARVARDMVEVLGNVRFGICVFTVLIALMIANQELAWFTWTHCLFFIPVWLAVNFVWDLLMPPGSGDPKHPASAGRPFFLKRMHCSNWRFALFLLIMSGFWTSFQQIFITMPEYIRDYTDTRPMVQAGRTVFAAIGKPNWIDSLAAVEDTELMQEFDALLRRARGVEPVAAGPPSQAGSPMHPTADHDAQADRQQRRARLARDPGLTPAQLTDLESATRRLNLPSAAQPLEALDLVDAARTILQYKVRIPPMELAALLEQALHQPLRFDADDLEAAIGALNRRLESKGKPVFGATERARLEAVLRTMLDDHGRLVPPATIIRSAESLSASGRALEPAELAVAVRDLAYRPVIWERVDAARQVNPEHIVNIDALSIVLLQVLISFLMARFHQFTTMIVGMVIASVGIGLSCVAGGTQIGPVGGSLLVVVVGIVTFAIGEMMASPTSQEYVGRIAPKERVAVYMGYYFVSIALGNLFSGILSGQLYGKLARDAHRPDLMWLAFGGIMLLTAVVFVLYNRFALPKQARHTLASASASD